MRVARVITRLNRGGPARTLLAVEPLLRARGVESLLLAGAPEPGEDDLAGEFAAAGIAVRRIAGLRRSLDPIADPAARRALGRELRAFRPDLIHTHTFKAGLLGRIADAGGAPRRVHTFHGHLFAGAFPWPVGGVLARLERWLARRTDLVIAVSERVRRDLCERWRVVARARTAVLPGVLLPDCAVPASAAERAAARAHLLPAVGPWLGTLARLTKVKAPLFFLDVAERVRAARPDARFVWVGDGDLRDRFLAEVARRRLSPGVRFVGWQPDVRAWHLALDVELLLSDQEGLPLSLLEATALRVPVVASDVGGVAEIVRDGIDGRIVPPRARDSAVAAILGLLARPLDLSGPAAQPGLAPERHAAELLALYERTLAAPPIAA